MRKFSEDMSSGRYVSYSPSSSTTPHSPQLSGFRPVNHVIEEEKYLHDLLTERAKVGPFMAVLPHAYRLLNQEIMRVTTLLRNASLLEQSASEHASPLTSVGFISNGLAEMNGRASPFQSERFGLLQSSPAHGWPGTPSSSSLIVKKTLRVDIPVDKYPNFNFVGRLLGPRGLSLKRVEASTNCRVLIRGHGSIKDPAREEMMRGKPGYEHLNEPLHVLIEAELPVEVIDIQMRQAREVLEEVLKPPMDESHDIFKQQQLRELAMLNGTLREESPIMSGSGFPFHDGFSMKRAKTRG